MNQAAAIARFEALASAVRLDVYRLLMREGPGGMVAGEIAAALELAPTNLSFHLKCLSRAGLVTVVQEGRYQRYRAHLPSMLEVLTYLTEECCGGAPELCAELATFSARLGAQAGKRG
ncbi:MAG: helix-turn-helix transcriptional regulator [Gammaproteobacteria bacterium]|nr:helix-turn-helix transcriptional regulator [Gammaproteobacteria bacterium]